jgi:hypothetical protein
MDYFKQETDDKEKQESTSNRFRKSSTDLKAPKP